MQISLQQLDAQLKKALPPLVFISGDEPLLVQEARDMVFSQATKRGFSEKEMIYMDSSFRIESLIESTQNISLFSEKKIVDIRNPSTKFDSALTNFLQSFLSNPFDDRIMVISTGKLTSAQQKAAWCDSIKKNALFVAIWPIALEAMPQWIMNRAKQHQLTLSLDLANMIAHFCEGNLLAAHQVIEKLNLMHANSVISREQLIAVLSDHARFSIFDLSNAIAKRDAKKTIRIMARLQQSGEEPILVLWNLSRVLREKNMEQGLQKAAMIDQVIKGASTGNAWQELLELSVMMCGVKT